MEITKGMTVYRAVTHIITGKVEIVERAVVGAGAIYITTEGIGGRHRITRFEAARRYSPTPESAREALRAQMRAIVASTERKLEQARHDLRVAFEEG